MKINISKLSANTQYTAQGCAPSGFRSRHHRRNRGRATPHGNSKTSLLDLSKTAPARFRSLIRPAALTALCILGLSTAAFAQDHQAKATPSEPAATRIEVDEQAGAVHIVIDGAERAVFDEDGLRINGDITYTGTVTDVSDARLKAGIRPLQDQPAKLQTLRPVAFGMAADPAGRTEYGLIAQEVEPVYPALVETRPGGAKAVNYTGLIAPLIAAVQDLQADNARLRARIEKLEHTAGQRPGEGAR